MNAKKASQFIVLVASASSFVVFPLGNKAFADTYDWATVRNTGNAADDSRPLFLPNPFSCLEQDTKVLSMSQSILVSMSPALMIAGMEPGLIYRSGVNESLWIGVSVGLFGCCQVMGWFHLTVVLRKSDWTLGRALVIGFLLQSVQACLLLFAFHSALVAGYFETYSGMMPSLFELYALDHRIWVVFVSLALLLLSWIWTFTWLSMTASQLPHKRLEALIHSITTNPIVFPLGIIVGIARREKHRVVRRASDPVTECGGPRKGVGSAQ